jgi:hypothetical protein
MRLKRAIEIINILRRLMLLILGNIVCVTRIVSYHGEGTTIEIINILRRLMLLNLDIVSVTRIFSYHGEGKTSISYGEKT